MFYDNVFTVTYWTIIIYLVFQKGEFIGRSALLKQREEGVDRMYIQLLLEDHNEETDLWPWGGEPIYRNGKYAGATTTTAYGFTFKQQVALNIFRQENLLYYKIVWPPLLNHPYIIELCRINVLVLLNF